MEEAAMQHDDNEPVKPASVLAFGLIAAVVGIGLITGIGYVRDWMQGPPVEQTEPAE
jgi:hypothetical protein